MDESSIRNWDEVDWLMLGIVVGLVVGVPMILPVLMFIAGVTIAILHLPGNLSANATLLVTIPLYAIWILLVLAIFRHGIRVKPDENQSPLRLRPFLRGLFCSLPLPAICFTYAYQSYLAHP
jgi:hypothetical protein